MLDYLLFRDEKAAGTAGGGFTSGAWRTRDLTVEVTDTGGHGSLAANQITLAAGTYVVRAKCPAYLCDLHYCKVQDITNAAVLALGTSELSGTNGASNSWAVGKFTIAGATVIEVQHRCQTTKATDGFGRAVNLDVTRVEIYTFVEFIRIG